MTCEDMPAVWQLQWQDPILVVAVLDLGGRVDPIEQGLDRAHRHRRVVDDVYRVCEAEAETGRGEDRIALDMHLFDAVDPRRGVLEHGVA